MVIDADHGTIDSPLHPDQVEILPGVPEAVADLTAAGFGLAIVSNQPAFAKGKTTKQNLEATHQLILEKIQAKGGTILSSHICFHKAEDHCNCRKPKTDLLKFAFQQNPTYDKATSWIVGDGVTDVQAGAAYGIKTAYLGARKGDALTIFHDLNIIPDAWLATLPEFVAHLRVHVN